MQILRLYLIFSPIHFKSFSEHFTAGGGGAKFRKYCKSTSLNFFDYSGWGKTSKITSKVNDSSDYNFLLKDLLMWWKGINDDLILAHEKQKPDKSFTLFYVQVAHLKNIHQYFLTCFQIGMTPHIMWKLRKKEEKRIYC